MHTVTIQWLADHQRQPGFLAEACGMSTGRLVDVVGGIAIPSDDELSVLADVMGVAVEELRQANPTREVESDPLQCYTVSEAATKLRMSADTFRAMMKDGQVTYSVLRGRTIRITGKALQEALDQTSRRGRVTGTTTPEPLSSRHPPPPPRDSPGHDGDDAPPPGRLL